MATKRSISSSDCAGHVSVFVGDCFVESPAGLFGVVGDASLLRLPMIGDLPASGELTPSATKEIKTKCYFHDKSNRSDAYIR